MVTNSPIAKEKGKDSNSDLTKEIAIMTGLSLEIMMDSSLVIMTVKVKRLM